jgi:5,10-methylenetetrahydromethanopterin reductase
MTTVTTWTRPPVTTASAAVTLAELAGERFVLGLGTMPDAWNRDHYGIDPAHPVARMREYVEFVRGAYAATPDHPFSRDGRFFAVRDFARSWPDPLPPLPPIHLAATRPGMARLAGEVADGVLYNVVHTQAWIRDVLSPALAEGAKSRQDSHVERGVMVRVVVHEPGGRERALEEARIAVTPYLRVPYLATVLQHHGWTPADATGAALEELVQIGTADQLLDKLHAYRDLVDWLLLAPPRMIPADRLHAWYETVFTELGPALA